MSVVEADIVALQAAFTVGATDVTQTGAPWGSSAATIAGVVCRACTGHIGVGVEAEVEHLSATTLNLETTCIAGTDAALTALSGTHVVDTIEADTEPGRAAVLVGGARRADWAVVIWHTDAA